MKHIFSILLPILSLICFAVVSRLFVEAPVYSVSVFHAYIVFLLGITAWFCLALGAVRRSYALYVSGLAFLSLGLSSGFFPDLWLRRPEATLAALAFTQIIAYILPRHIVSFSHRFAGITLVIGLLSLLPFAAAIYTQWLDGSRMYIAAVADVFLLAALTIGWNRRQRKLNPVGALTLFFFIAICTILTVSIFYPEHFGAVNRRQIEELVFFGLLIIGAVHVADQLVLEQRLRSGPHMELDASMKDALTNLANRRALEMYGPRLIAQSQEAGKAVSVIVADIDHFKQINDLHGHLTGDVVLQRTAANLSNQVRKSDMVARYGGEEFVIILPGSALAPALRLAERMRSSVENDLVLHENQSIRRTASFGVATAFPEDPATLSDLIGRADANLYRAKRDGRNQVKADKLIADDF